MLLLLLGFTAVGRAQSVVLLSLVLAAVLYCCCLFGSLGLGMRGCYVAGLPAVFLCAAAADVMMLQLLGCLVL